MLIAMLCIGNIFGRPNQLLYVCVCVCIYIWNTIRIIRILLFCVSSSHCIIFYVCRIYGYAYEYGIMIIACSRGGGMALLKHVTHPQTHIMQPTNIKHKQKTHLVSVQIALFKHGFFLFSSQLNSMLAYIFLCFVCATSIYRQRRILCLGLVGSWSSVRYHQQTDIFARHSNEKILRMGERKSMSMFLHRCAADNVIRNGCAFIFCPSIWIRVTS